MRQNLRWVTSSMLMPVLAASILRMSATIAVMTTPGQMPQNHTTSAGKGRPPVGVGLLAAVDAGLSDAR